jgi:hypothetical protein
MIPHFIDLICRGLSLAALIWGVFSMGFMSAERKAASASVSQSENGGPAPGGQSLDELGTLSPSNGQAETSPRPDNSEVEPARINRSRFQNLG